MGVFQKARYYTISLMLLKLIHFMYKSSSFYLLLREVTVAAWLRYLQPLVLGRVTYKATDAPRASRRARQARLGDWGALCLLFCVRWAHILVEINLVVCVAGLWYSLYFDSLLKVLISLAISFELWIVRYDLNFKQQCSQLQVDRKEFTLKYLFEKNHNTVIIN